jgi:ribosomal protein S15P/S13E
VFNWFKRNKTRKVNPADAVNSDVKEINYPAKIIIAWSKAIEGNDEFLIWLKDNGYEELFMATYAILLKQEARDWLSENGYPHLMAMINAAEGNESAQKWLQIHDFEILYHIAMAVESEQSSWEWIGKNAPADIFILTKTIKQVKDGIEENHNDIHSFGKD